MTVTLSLRPVSGGSTVDFTSMTDAYGYVTMTTGLRTLLRMDPDVVLVGEIRDAQTAEIAMRAASSGPKKNSVRAMAWSTLAN